MSGFDFTFLTFSYAVAEYFTTIGIDFPLYAAYLPMLFSSSTTTFLYVVSLFFVSLHLVHLRLGKKFSRSSRVRTRHSSIQIDFLSQFIFAFKFVDQ